LTDFGLAKDNVNELNKANSFCGTPEYLAPEILDGEGYGKEIDWWSLGVIVYELLVGQPPFYNKHSKERLFKTIKLSSVKYPQYLSDRAIAFLKQLLIKDCSKRLGANGIGDVKEHPFFKDVNWELLIQKKIKPPFVPVLKSNIDTKYIDSEFLDEPPCDSFNTCDILDSKNSLFEGFSFNNEKSISNIITPLETRD
jgi:serine/threonine protein kinase